jgi:alpha-tubulin suppressor-like RCC1 family protein
MGPNNIARLPVAFWRGVIGARKIRSLVMGTHHVLAIVDTNRCCAGCTCTGNLLFSWGFNTFGQLGDTTTSTCFAF